MSTAEKFEDLRIWQEARELVKEIYTLTKTKPFNNDFGLCSQIQRAAVSVMSNITEGSERGSNKEFIQFLYQSKASCCEVRSQLYIVMDLEYASPNIVGSIQGKCDKLSKEIGALIVYLKKSSLKGKKYSNLN